MGAHVLFVDDDESNLVVWEAACGDSFAVLTASNAQEALDHLSCHEVGVVLADQRMPRTTGIELLEQVRHAYPGTIRILITAYSDLHAAIDAINRGRVRRYLRKPCAPEELRAEVRDALELYNLQSRMGQLERRLLQTERVYALGLVAAGLAHELRNPISWIKDNVELTSRELVRLSKRLAHPDVDVEPIRARLAELDEGLGDALLGVQRLMDIVSGIELPTRHTSDETAEITEVLRLVLRIVRGELRRTCQVLLDTKEVPRVCGSSTKLGQVVLNLVVNAMQALASSSPAEGLISIRLYEDADTAEVVLQVSDNGPGIPAERADSIFDPFFTTKGSEGTGLGLAISRRIVEEVGGSIVARNASEGGATFTVRLPRAVEEASEA